MFLEPILTTAKNEGFLYLHLFHDAGQPTEEHLKVHKIENFFDSDFGICVISLLVMSKY